MTQNQFKPFAISQHAVVQSQEDYEKSAALKDGFKTGLARSSEVNKAIRQATSVAAVVAGFTAEKSGEDMLDNGDIDTMKQHFETAIRTISSTLSASAEGTGDTLAATFIPTLKQLTSGKTVLVRAREKNLTKTPTFKADENDAKTIVKGNNLPLEAGDIAGAGHWLELQYDGQLDKWVLQNPAKGVSPLNGVPVGTVEYFAMEMPPAGYLKADGSAISREVYPDLFAAIGTTFGEGDGETTFNLPDLIDRFAQGSNAPGQKVEAGLPTFKATLISRPFGDGQNPGCVWGINGAAKTIIANGSVVINNGIGNADTKADVTTIDPSFFNPIYGASETVQPPALTLLPCIKAFDAATNPGLIDITELANDVADHSVNKLDKKVNGIAVKYVTETYNDGTNWYRKWSDGWLEQGGQFVVTGGVGALTVINLNLPSFVKYFSWAANGIVVDGTANAGGYTQTINTSINFFKGWGASQDTVVWYAGGQGA